MTVQNLLETGAFHAPHYFLPPGCSGLQTDCEWSTQTLPPWEDFVSLPCLLVPFLFFFFCNRLNDLFQFCVPRSATSPDTRAKESIKFLFINKIMPKHFRITGMRSGTGGPDASSSQPLSGSLGHSPSLHNMSILDFWT